MPVNLKDQVVLVVGASSGIGRETAILFAREGAKVMASARREDRLQQLRQEMQGERRTLEVFAADASAPDQMKKLADQTRSKLGPVDILVYATGTNTPNRYLDKLTPEQELYLASWSEGT